MPNPTTHRFHQQVRRQFNLKEPFDAGVEESFLPTVQTRHAYNLEDFKHREENLVSGGAFFTAAVGNSPQFTLVAQPNTIAVIKRIWLLTGSAAATFVRVNWVFQAFNPGLGASIAQNGDGRLNNPKGVGTAAPNFIFQVGNVAALPASPFLWYGQASGSGTFNATLPHEVDWVLFGGFSDPKNTASSTSSWQVLVTFETQNILAAMSFSGYYRHVEPAEQF